MLKGVSKSAELIILWVMLIVMASCSRGTTENSPAFSPEVNADFTAKSEVFFDNMSKPGAKLDAQSMRFILYYLDEPDAIGWRTAMCLVRGVEVEPQYRDVAAAILEEKAVRAGMKDKDIWLYTIAMVLGLPIGEHDSMDASIDTWSRARTEGALDEGAKRFAERCLTDQSFQKQSAAIPILTEACVIGGKEERWALDQVARKIETSDGSERRFWIASCGALGNKMLFPASGAAKKGRTDLR
jgi:hypothetical protein